MDNPELIAIIIATVIATLVKEVVVWLARKTTALTGPLITRVVSAVRKHSWIAFDRFMSAFSIILVVYLVFFTDMPLTKELVMAIGVNCGGYFYWMDQYLRERDRQLFDKLVSILSQSTKVPSAEEPKN